MKISLAIALTATTLLVPVPISASTGPETMVTMISESGDYIGGGINRFYHPDNAEITLSGTAASLSFRVSGGNRGDYFNLDFAAPPGETLSPGVYTRAQRAPFREAGRPGINISGDGRGCNEVAGRFEVKEITTAADGTIESVWIVYEHRCEGGSKALIGDARYNASGSGGNLMIGPRELRWPDADTGEAAPVAPFVVVNPTDRQIQVGKSTLAGTDSDLFTVRIDSCDGKTLEPTESCEVWVRYSPDRSGPVEAMLRIPEANGFQHTVPLEAFVYGGTTRFVIDGEEGDYISGGKRYAYDPTNASMNVRGSYQHVSMYLTANDGSDWSVDFNAPDGDILAPDTRYEGATRYPFNDSGPGLDVSGNGRGCNTLTGSFYINDISVNSYGELERFGASFEQRCDGGEPLYGVLDFRMAETTPWSDPSNGASPTPTPASSTSPTPAPEPSGTPEPEPSIVPVHDARSFDSDVSVWNDKMAWTNAPVGMRETRVVLKRGDQPKTRISAKGTVGYAGALYRNKLVYQQRNGYRSYNSQIRLYDAARNKHVRLPSGINTPHFEWAPSVWGKWLTFSRDTTKANKPRHLLWLANLRSGRKQVLASGRPGKELKVGQMAGAYITWLKCLSASSCNVFTHNRQTGTTFRMPRPRGTVVYAPSVTTSGDTYFARTASNECGAAEIFRRSIDGGIEKVLQFPEDMDLGTSWVDPQGDGTVRLYMSTSSCLDPEDRDIHYADIEPT